MHNQKIHDELMEVYNSLVSVSSQTEELKHVACMLRLGLYPEAAGKLGYIKAMVKREASDTQYKLKLQKEAEEICNEQTKGQVGHSSGLIGKLP